MNFVEFTNYSTKKSVFINPKKIEYIMGDLVYLGYTLVAMNNRDLYVAGTVEETLNKLDRYA